MANSIPLLIHIGFHKTGSTWLQQHFFSERSRGFYEIDDAPRHHIVHDLVTPDAFSYSADAVRDRYHGFIERARAHDCVPVISHERLSGYPPSGGYDRRLIADRLAETFPEAHILIVIREQIALIRSMYSQYIADGGHQSLEDFLHHPEPRLGRRPYFRFEFYEFHKLIGYYQQKFGKERVHVLPFELLARRPQQFADAISRLAGLPDRAIAGDVVANKGRPYVMQAFVRRANRYFSKSELSPGAVVSIPHLARRLQVLKPVFDALVPAKLDLYYKGRATARIRTLAGNRYEASNKLTSQLIGCDLSALGYPQEP